MLTEWSNLLRIRWLRFYEKQKHLLILFYFPIYLLWFQYVEKNVTTHFHVVHVALDDYIPFCEYFVIPYLLWFPFIAWGIAYMALHNKTDYYKLCAFLFTGMTVFLIISTVYPNGHYLRPTYFAHHNACTMLIDWLYATDTPTNLFPSIHVYNSLGVCIAVLHNERLRQNKTVCLLTVVLTVSIIMATVLIKQHSVFDVGCAFVLGGIMYCLVYRRSWSSAASAEKRSKTLSLE